MYRLIVLHFLVTLSFELIHLQINCKNYETSKVSFDRVYNCSQEHGSPKTHILIMNVIWWCEGRDGRGDKRSIQERNHCILNQHVQNVGSFCFANNYRYFSRNGFSGTNHNWMLKFNRKYNNLTRAYRVYTYIHVLPRDNTRIFERLQRALSFAVLF